MPKPRITIIGLGLIGASIGLALSREQRDFEIVGHDKSPAAAGQAKKLQAVDKTDWNLISACEGAGLVILALPLGAIRETMQALAGELAAGAVVLDTASVKAPVQAWADELLPPTVTFVGTHPIVAVDQVGTAGETFSCAVAGPSVQRPAPTNARLSPPPTWRRGWAPRRTSWTP